MALKKAVVGYSVRQDYDYGGDMPNETFTWNGLYRSLAHAKRAVKADLEKWVEENNDGCDPDEVVSMPKIKWSLEDDEHRFLHDEGECTFVISPMHWAD